MDRKLIARAALLLPVLFASSLALGEGGLISNIEQAGEQLSDTPQTPQTTPPPRLIPGLINTHTLSVGIGQTFLYGDLSNYGENAIATDLYYSFSASHSFHFLLNLHYASHKLKQKKAVIKGLAMGIKGSLWQFDALSPYAIAGLGFYAPRVKGGNDGDKLSRDKVVLGAHLGLGAELQLNRRLNTGLLFHYHNPFDNNEGDTNEAEGFYGKMMVTIGYTF